MSTTRSIRETAATLAAAYHVNGELVRDGAMVHGWCWSPARPQERLMVELLRDDEKIATAVAARLRLDLARAGVCDGYHGFSFQMPTAPFARLEVREVATGQAFGRIMGEHAAQPSDWDARTGSLAEAVTRAHALLHRLAPNCHHAADRSLRPPAGLRLPAIATPAFTLLLDADESAQMALATVHALAPLLHDHQAELLVVDAGCSAISAALASIPGLNYIRHGSTNAAARLNAALSQARGARVMLLGATENAASDVLSLLANPPTAQEIVVSAALLPATDPTLAAAGIPASAMLLFAPREVFAAVGGFDPSCDDCNDLVILEFALRARALGHTLLTLPAGPRRRQPTYPAQGARQYFQQTIGKATDA